MSSVSVGSLQAAPSSERPETTIGSRRAMRRAKRLSSCWCGVFITVATVSLALPKLRSNNLADRCPLTFLLLAPIVKTFAALLADTNIAQDDSIARGRGHLRNAVTHRARAEHTYRADWASRSVIVFFVRVSAQRALAKPWPNRKVDRIEATVMAGACLVRLTCTLIVILYAQPKTPILFL